MSNNHTPPDNDGPGAPVPGPRPAASTESGRPTTDLGVLETLASTPVAEHLAIFEDLQASLTADLDATSLEQA
ncbi:hypothetical protein KRR55_15320 [Paeniglutamicibacter sp. ABSL32-1]|uniref:hypothetical protein n=1 Tax=Paeniglutamicibacter quisquiliarum TaxID=2849498 RepID=UPI001C2CC70E|nr:hypothetical protein [Paeniglutamicibacter quisquiliarum]MBV1780486.1 hypothetical protein [Paeniglutamicibacter quisquiliarum]